MAKGKSRREALMIGLGLVGIAAAWQIWIGRPRAFDFEPIPGLPGWRQVSGGEVSTGSAGAVFAGIGASGDTEPLSPERLCDVLFGRAPGQGVPVAIFTDLACPFCRQVAPSLAARARDGRIALSWLEWPIYGARSEEVARALIAAEQMGQAEALRGPLYAGPPAPLSRVVAASGLSRSQLASRMESASVARRLDDIDGAAALLRLPGTPSMMIGRTLVVGALSPSELDRLIEMEARDDAVPCG